ncbi:MAG TPA: hypothetical protein VMZ30_13785 [Pyrinomonadaceae bacterium]|nr:hypothetical protein [Pyrinomonadaceae bacterium]
MPITRVSKHAQSINKQIFGMSNGKDEAALGMLGINVYSPPIHMADAVAPKLQTGARA